MMTRALAALLLFHALGCKPESARRSDHAAEQVVEKRKTGAADLAEAEQSFAQRRKSRIAILEGKHSVIASQTSLISGLTRGFALSDASRLAINLKLHAFQMQLDQTANAIDALKRVGVENWKARDEAVVAEMDQLDEARQAAWNSLAAAPLVEPPAPNHVSVARDGQSTRVQRHARRAH